jgi:hypothetical protein
MTLVEIAKKADSTLDEHFLKRYSRLREDFVWILANKEKLRTIYTNKYIAVENKTVRFTGDTIEELMSNIRIQNEQIDDFVIEYIGRLPANLLL